MDEGLTINEQQLKVIEKTSGPCIVLAGAGTGKTSTIVEKIKYLVDEGFYNADEILCLTFSNEATNSLKSKVQNSLKSFKQPTIRTFHGFCSDILKEDAYLLNLENEFQILLPDDAKILLHRDLGVLAYKVKNYIQTISTANDFGIDRTQILEHVKKLEDEIVKITLIDKLEEKILEIELKLNTLHLEPNTKEIRQIKKECKTFLDVSKKYKSFMDFLDVWEKFDNVKREKKLFDYSDLNKYVLELFRKFGAEKYTNNFKYIIIDEFQDTNKLQFELIEHIAYEHKNITIVGDNNQSIYGFRGSYKNSFNHFIEKYGARDEDIISLYESWRSTNSILDVAYDLIKNNYEDPKECFKTKNAKGIKGEKVKLVETKNMAEEARVIGDIVEEKLKTGIEPKEICVMYRTHRQGDYLKEYLKSRNIEMAQVGKSDLISRPEIKTTISYLAMLNNLTSRTSIGEQSWWHLFHYKNIISMPDSLKIGRFLKKHKTKSIDEVLILSLDELDLNENSKKIISNILEKLNFLHEKSNLSLPNLVLEIYEITGLNRAFSHKRTNKNIESLMNLKKFYSIAEKFAEIHGDDLEKFIDYMEILKEIGITIDESEIQNDNAIRIMTMHSTKGLEYECVIVSNMAEGRFPLSRTKNEPLIPKELLYDIQYFLKKIEEKEGHLSDSQRQEAIKQFEKESLLVEERRLAYVAFTRAKKDLYLTFARSYNEGEEDVCEESIFLEEIGYDDWNNLPEVIHDNIEYNKDDNILNTSIAPCSVKDLLMSKIKNEIILCLDNYDTDFLLDRVSEYRSLSSGKIVNLNNVDEENLKLIIEKGKNNFSGLKFNKSMITMSPSSIMEYDECPKKFELSRILHLPKRNDFSEDADAADVGSFIHKVLEDGVNMKFSSEDMYLEHAKKLMGTKDYENMPEKEINSMIKVFYARNKDKINEKSQTEVPLPYELNGFKFFGIADRIDELEDGSLEIIDYKSNKSKLSPKKRAFQMGFYAIAAKENFGKEVSSLNLEMLKCEKPDEFLVEGNDVKPKSGRGQGFNLDYVKEEYIRITNLIAKDFESEFKTSKSDGPCRFCGFKFYCPKWESK